jgi:carbonic anhydrase
LTARRHPKPDCTADEALARLKRGDSRFVSGAVRFRTIQKKVLAELVKGEQP